MRNERLEIEATCEPASSAIFSSLEVGNDGPRKKAHTTAASPEHDSRRARRIERSVGIKGADVEKLGNGVRGAHFERGRARRKKLTHALDPLGAEVVSKEAALVRREALE